MFRALLWKEWREQRLVAAAGLAVAALMPFIIDGASRLGSRRPVADLMPQALLIAYALFLWPMLAGVTAGATIAGEYGERTIDFLFSRPVRRTTIWSAKVGMAVASFAAIVAGSIGILALVGLPVRAMIPVPALDLPGMTGVVLVLAGAALALVFACSVFFSSLLSRPLHATLLGIFSAVLLLAAITLVWARLDLMPALEPQWIALDVLLSAGLLLLCSLAIFTRGESLRDGRTRRLGVIGGLGTLAAAVLVVPFVYSVTRLTLSTAVFAETQLSPQRDAVAVTAVTKMGHSPEAWIVRPDRGGVQRVGGRLTFTPSVSPDGKKIAYFSQRDALGLRSARMSLRVVSADGSGDRALVEDLDATFPVAVPEAVFAPDSDQVAFVSLRRLHIARLDGNDRYTFDLPAARWLSARIAGWSRRGDEVFVLDSSSDQRSAVRLTAVSVPAGRTRVVFEEPEASAWLPAGWSATTSKGCTILPLGLRRRAPDNIAMRLVLVPADGSAARWIEQPICPSVASLSSDERALAYAACPVPSRGEITAEVHFVSLDTGVDHVVGSVGGFPLMAFLSPAGDRVALRLFDRASGRRSVSIVGAAGTRTTLEGDWQPLGWSGRDRLLIATPSFEERGGTARPSRLALADASTGAIDTVYP